MVRLDITYFIELKIKNWKHYSKIIFKCVNSTVRSIFNEKVVEKWCLWVREQCTSTLFTIEKSTKLALKKKMQKLNLNIAYSAQQSHHPFSHQKKKKKQFHHPLYHNFCQAKCTLSAFVAFLFLLMLIVWSQNLELGGVILVVSALYYISN